MMKRLRIPLLTAGGVVLCAFVLIPMAFDTLDIGPEIVEVSKSMLHMPSPVSYTHLTLPTIYSV